MPARAEKAVKGEETVAAKLRELERGLRKLTERSQVVREVLGLWRRDSGLFAAGEGGMGTLGQGDEEVKRAIVLSHASAFYEMAARGARLRDLEKEKGVPSAEASRRLVELGPRLDAVGKRMEGQGRRVEGLRGRSVRVVEKGVRGVVGVGEEWVDWEAKVRGVGREVGRVEGLRRVEEG